MISRSNVRTMIQSALLAVVIEAPGKTSLAPGTSTTFKVTFKPAAKGKRVAALAIASNDPDEDPFGIKLSGEGVR
jgi:hypothetical protein